MRGPVALPGAAAAAWAVFLTLLLANLSYPLLWFDEADSAVFGQRVLEHGYPKAHGEPEILYNLDPERIDPRTDAYRSELWGLYYFAALGAALAEGGDDLYARTARMRLPFALAGALGVVLVLLTALRVVDGSGRRWRFAIAFALASAYSVSLLLHLREARYYALVVLLVAAVLYLHARYHVSGDLGLRGYLGIAPLLVLLFATWFPGFAVLGLALGLDVARRAWRRRGDADLPSWLARAALPLVLAGAAALPLALLLDLFAHTEARLGRLSASARSHGTNLAFVAVNLLRYEFAAPALVARLAVLWQLRGRATTPPALARRSDLVTLLWLVIAVHWLVVSRSPLALDRYFVALSPLITAALLLDALSLVDLLRAPGSGRRAVAAFALLGAALAPTLVLRLPEFAGRLYEVHAPYRGPLDFVVPYLAERHPDASRLVIATNYEGPAYSWYLGSRVTVGYYGRNLQRDLELTPDVIVPRAWGRHLDALRMLDERGDYVTQRFPVASYPVNNVPSLWRYGDGDVTHQFRTLPPPDPEAGVFVLERRDAPPRRAPSRPGRADR